MGTRYITWRRIHPIPLSSIIHYSGLVDAYLCMLRNQMFFPCLQDSLAIHSFVVPTLEVEGPAIRTYRDTGDGAYPLPMKVIYLDLQVGELGYCPALDVNSFDPA